ILGPVDPVSAATPLVVLPAFGVLFDLFPRCLLDSCAEKKTVLLTVSGLPALAAAYTSLAKLWRLLLLAFLGSSGGGGRGPPPSASNWLRSQAHLLHTPHTPSTATEATSVELYQ